MAPVTGTCPLGFELHCCTDINVKVCTCLPTLYSIIHREISKTKEKKTKDMRDYSFDILKKEKMRKKERERETLYLHKLPSRTG